MSCAWPLFQVDLWGAFDHATDLNDRQVIERGNRVLKRDGGGMITQVAVGVGQSGEGGRWVREWGDQR